MVFAGLTDQEDGDVVVDVEEGELLPLLAQDDEDRVHEVQHLQATTRGDDRGVRVRVRRTLDRGVRVGVRRTHDFRSSVGDFHPTFTSGFRPRQMVFRGYHYW